MKWQAVFFDFDGVIVDSVSIKGQAFGELFREYGPCIEKKVVEYHLTHGGVSREEKFKYYYDKLIKHPLTNEQLEKLCQQFSDLVLDKVISASFLNRVLENLEKLKSNMIHAYIVSGTPQHEIKFIVEKRKLNKYFRGVYGSPREKGEIITEILITESFNPVDCLFIGDSLSDYEGAKITGVNFLGIVSDSQMSPFPKGTNISEFIELDLSL